MVRELWDLEKYQFMYRRHYNTKGAPKIWSHYTRGRVYILHFALPPPPGPGAKIWVIGWLGGKYDVLVRKNVNMRGKRCKNGQKVENLHCTSGKKCHFEKGGGAKISYLWQIYVPAWSYRRYVECRSQSTFQLTPNITLNVTIPTVQKMLTDAEFRKS